jgi:hypothetical protein
MFTITEQLTEAQKYAMSIKPIIGGFPILTEVLRQEGIEKLHTTAYKVSII